MKNLVKLIQNYLIYSLPIVLVSMVWSSFVPAGSLSADNPFILKALWEVLS